jgi:hypothetical protein
MENRFIPLTVIEVVDMLISGKEKLAIDLVNELALYRRESNNKRRVN